MPFLQQLQAEAMQNMDDPINEMMQRMCAPLIPPACSAPNCCCSCEIQMTLACDTATALPFPI